ncbi:MAG: AAA family ATPase [Candidatus ainarchaeum sp.]|nr:AAA family ATPase [Candidatus ainarchaeum sp.]MDD3976348.1 AAA family ATPase [Candidatus ainarchaeum sp.]
MADNIFYEFLNQDSVFIDKNKISPHYTPDKLPFRDDQIKDLSMWLSPALKSQKPHNVFIYGKVGTGKTSVVRHVVNQLDQISIENKFPLYPVYLNCRNYQTKYAVLFYCVQLFYPDKNFIGYSRSFIYDKFLTFIKDNKLNFLIILDEIDKIKDKEIDDIIYTLTRSNDELLVGSVSMIGISNNLFFKSRLDPRTKSSLCEQEAVYPPYNAQELREILTQRVNVAFKPGVVTSSAINSAAAFAAKESGDARTAVMFLLKAGEISDRDKLKQVTDVEVLKAKEKVEQEVIKSMVLTLPVQLQLVLLAITHKSDNPKGILKIDGSFEENVLYSGEIYEMYSLLAEKYDEKPVSMRWFREYITELETYGFITTMQSGKGVKGNTTLIKLGVDSKTIQNLLLKEFEA